MLTLAFDSFDSHSTSDVSNLNADALDYIQRVEAQDGQMLEANTRQVISTFFAGLSADGILTKLKSALILGAARTLAGALVPLLPTMAAPTNGGFVAGDRTRALGLVGGTNKFINLNRLANAEPQDNYHQVSFITQILGISWNTGVVIAAGTGSVAAASHIGVWNAASSYRARTVTDTVVSEAGQPGFHGFSRAAAASFDIINNNTNVTRSLTSVANLPRSTYVLARNNSDTGDAAPTSFSLNRVLFVSVGEATNLTLYKPHLVTLAAGLSTL